MFSTCIINMTLDMCDKYHMSSHVIRVVTELVRLLLYSHDWSNTGTCICTSLHTYEFPVLVQCSHLTTLCLEPIGMDHVSQLC